MTSADLYLILRRHAGHSVRLYTRSDASVALECVTCNQVFMSADPPAGESEDLAALDRGRL